MLLRTSKGAAIVVPRMNVNEANCNKLVARRRSIT
jgi:hypothetical protein